MGLKSYNACSEMSWSQLFPKAIMCSADAEAEGTGDEVVASGGRVLSVTARGDSLAEARTRAYTAVDLITLEGSHHRRDIALRASMGD